MLRVDEPSNSEGGPTEGPYIPDTVPYVPFKTQDEDPNDAPTDTAAIAAEERELLKEDAAARKKKEAIKTPPSPVPDPDMGAVEPAEGWSNKPEYTKPMPTAYFRGQAGYSKFYPPEARSYKYSRHLMVAVDGSKESERASEWAIKHLCRSGDLLHIVHVATAGTVDPHFSTYYSGPPDPRAVTDPEMVDLALNPEAQDAYWAAAVLRTEDMLDTIYKRLKATHGEMADAGQEMTSFPQPIELDAVLDTTWEPVAEVVLRKAMDHDVEMVVVSHHSKNWWEEALAGSVTKYLIDRSKLNVVVLH